MDGWPTEEGCTMYSSVQMRLLCTAWVVMVPSVSGVSISQERRSVLAPAAKIQQSHVCVFV